VTDTCRLPPEHADLEYGFVERLAAVSLEIQGNMPWMLQISAISDESTDDSSEAATALLSRILIRVSGGNYVPLASGELLLAVGERGVHKLSIDYKFLIEPDEFVDSPLRIDLTYSVLPVTQDSESNRTCSVVMSPTRNR